MLLSVRLQPQGVGRLNSPAFALTGIGFYLTTCIVGLTLVGRWLDGRFDTQPLLTLVFLLLGLFFGFYGAYQQLQDVLTQLRERDAKKGRN